MINDDDAIESRTVRHVSWRLLPFLFILYIFNYLDRSNVSIAALQMNDELHFSAAIFGLGAGVFFFGYALFEIPSNLVLARVGARRWIARIMVTWGLLAVAMMWIRTPTQFYIVRFLLGVAEAGFFPGVIYYLAQWFPMNHRARAGAAFTVAIPLSSVIGGALAGPLLALGGTAELSGWQWLFLIEGVPAVMLGIVVWFFLNDRPNDAKWLPADGRAWLVSRLQQEQATSRTEGIGLLRIIREPFCWALALMYFSYYTMALGYVSWLPMLVRAALNTQNAMTGFITAGISLVAASVYFIVARWSDLTHDRYRYPAAGLALSIAGCLGAAFAPLPWLKVISLAVIPIGGGVFLPSFWCLPTTRFKGASAASAIALISSVGASGGFFGPTIIGYMKHASGQDVAGFVTLAVIGALGCGVCLVLRWNAVVRQLPAPALTT
jgi:ACS family tartrate transporter-like MFS transporter